MKRKMIFVFVSVLLMIFALAPLMSLPVKAASVSVFTDDFEGSWYWSRSDLESDSGYDYWGASNYRSYGGSTSAWCAEIGSHNVTETVWTEGFEDGIPGSAPWYRGDLDSDSGSDYWDETTYKKYSGSYSAWCADIGTHETTIFSDGFEGSWSWTRGDWNSTNGLDYWDYSTNRAYAGSRSAWCAGVSNHPYGASYYDNYMDAYMYKSVGSLSAYDSVTLSYRYWADLEPGNYDWVEAMYYVSGSGWTFVDKHSASTSGWVYDTVNIPTTATYVGFRFHSDYTGASYQGAYLDDVKLSGYQSNYDLHQYDNDMQAYLYRSSNLTGYNSAALSYRYWLSSESNYDYLKVCYYSGGTWTNINPVSGNSSGWQYASVSIPTTATYVGFNFTSDNVYCGYEGAYIDSVTLRGAKNVANSDLHQYDDDMQAYMIRSVSLGSYSSATLSFRYWLQSETNYDYLKVCYSDGGQWINVNPLSGNSGGWQYASVSIPTTATYVGFNFTSDYVVSGYEGAYIDNVECTGYTSGSTTAYLAVRGYDNAVYYRSYNAITNVWGSYSGLPGSTVDTPAATILGNELHFVVRGGDGQTLWHSYKNLVTNAFSGWSSLGGTSPSTPTLTNNGTHIALVVRGSDNLIYTKLYSVASHSWGSWIFVPTGSTGDSIGAAMVGNELHISVRGMSGDVLWYCSGNLDTNVWSGWSALGGTSPSPPTFAGNGTHLALVVRGSNNVIYYKLFNLGSSTWGSWMIVPAGSTGSRPAATFANGLLQVVVRGESGGIPYHGRMNLDAYAFSGWVALGGSTPSPPTLTS